MFIVTTAQKQVTTSAREANTGLVVLRRRFELVS